MMMGKKRGMLIASLLLVSLLAGGCGEDQMDAAAKIQSQETVTVEELALLARTEKVDIRGQEQWQTKEGLPVTVLQTNAGDLLMIWDCAEVPGGREAVERAGWAPQYY